MNLDPNNTLYLIDGTVWIERELKYRWNGIKLYSQDETLCLLGLIEEKLWGSELYQRFNDVHPGRTRTAIKMKTYLLKNKPRRIANESKKPCEQLEAKEKQTPFIDEIV